MKLLEIKLHNCFSYRSAFVKLDNRGLVLITGWSHDDNNENGSGKSSLIPKAISWWLWGVTPEGIRTDDVINRHVGPIGTRKKVTAQIEGTFIGVDGVTYRLTRSRNPNKLVLSTNKEVISGTSMAETQLKLNKLLGRDYNSFIQADVFGQGKTKHFFSLSPTEKIKLVEGLLPVKEKLQEAGKLSEESVRKLELILNETNKNADLLNKEAHMLSEQERGAIKEGNTWIENQEKKISSLVDSINAEAKRIEEVRPVLKEAIAQQESFETPSDTDAIKDKMKEHQQAGVAWVKWVEEQEAQLRDTETRAIEKEFLVKKWRDGYNCPTCKRKLPANEYVRLKEETNGHIYQWEELKNEIASCKHGLDRGRRYVSESSATVVKYQEAINNYSVIQAQAKETGAKVDLLKEQLIDRSISLQQLAKELKDEKNPFMSTIVSARSKIEELNPQINALQERTEVVSEDLHNITFWKRQFKKHIPMMMLDNSLSYLEARTNLHLQNLQNPKLYVQFTLEEDDDGIKFIATAEHKTGGLGYTSLSGGEKQLINFSVGLAFADLAETQTGGANSVMILDEPFENLSPYNSECVVTYLQELANKKSSIFLISHNEYLKGLILNKIHVVKRDGISRVDAT